MIRDVNLDLLFYVLKAVGAQEHVRESWRWLSTEQACERWSPKVRLNHGHAQASLRVDEGEVADDGRLAFRWYGARNKNGLYRISLRGEFEIAPEKSKRLAYAGGDTRSPIDARSNIALV